MDQLETTGSTGAGLAILGIMALSALLPVILAETRFARGPTLAALLLCLAAFAIAGLAGAAGLGGVIFLPLASACWFAALFCGLAGWLDNRAAARAEETAFRLLHNDSRGLRAPNGLKHPPRVEPDRFT